MSLLILFAAKYLIFLLFVSLVYFWFIGERELVVRAFCAVGLVIGIALLIGFLFPTLRPFEKLGMETPPVFFFEQNSNLRTASFPSKHAATTAALAFVVMRKKKLLGRFLLLGSLAVGVGRYLALVHTGWDILGGIVVGWLSAQFWLINCRVESEAQAQN